jgi:ankyrin repeat protein
MDNDKTFETYSSALDIVCLAIESRFRVSLKDLLEQLQGSPIATEERDLRRALDVIRLFEDTASRRGIVNQPHKVHAAILKRLLAISQSRGDVIQVKRLEAEHRHLCRLEQGDGQPGLDRSLADVFQKSAETAWKTLQDLSIDNGVMNALHMNEHFSLPVANKAMHVGHREVASILFRRTADESRFSDGLLCRSFFHIAVDRNDIDLLHYLVQHHAEYLDAVDVFHRTSLSIAASAGNLPAFEYLANAGANLQRRDLGGRSILNHACASGNAQMVKYLLERGLEVNDDIFGLSSPFKEAAARGHFEICSLILAHGVSDDEMIHASMEAARSGHSHVVELIHGKLNEGLAAAVFLSDARRSMRSTPDSYSPFVNFDPPDLMSLDPVAPPSMSACISASSSSASSSSIYAMSEPVYDGSSQRSDSPGSQSYPGS